MAIYQIQRSYQTETREFLSVFDSVIVNAIEGYGFTVDLIRTTASGRCRITLSGDFPQAEIDSFAGEIITV